LGGPNHYEGRDMELAHRHLSIKQEDFEEVAAILQDNLQDAGVEEGDIQVIMNIVAGYADQIIAK
jgi:hemoglobin